MPVEPITPEEANALKVESIPDFVMQAWNEIIVENLHGGRSTFTMKALTDRIVAKAGAENVVLPRATIFEKGWLGLEDVFRKAGWKVEYNQPAYNETYEPHYIFGLVLKRGG